MAREPMVTRTITTTKANVMCLDVSVGATVIKEVVAPRTYKDNEELLKVAKTIVETETLKAVHIVSKEVIETLYGMPERVFIENAQVIPARTKEDKAE